MSYILDALKRADAERERGAVPGLHAQPAALPLPEEPGRSPLPPWAWGLGGLGLALLGMLVWSLWRDDPATDVPQRAPPLAVATGPSSVQPLPVPGGLLPAQQAERLPQGEVRSEAHEQKPAPQQRDTRDEAEKAPADAPPARQAAKPGGAAAATEGARTSALTTPRTAPTTAAEASAPQDIATPPAPRVLAQHELPDHVRRQLPPLVIGGAMYSDNPANRMLVINSQLFHEGDKLGPDLTLEEIKLKSAVLRFQRWRYSVSY